MLDSLAVSCLFVKQQKTAGKISSTAKYRWANKEEEKKNRMKRKKKTKDIIFFC